MESIEWLGLNNLAQIIYYLRHVMKLKDQDIKKMVDNLLNKRACETDPEIA